MPFAYNAPLAKDALTGETFGKIRVGTLQEKRLMSCQNPSDRIDQKKLFFGPPDNKHLQFQRLQQFMKRQDLPIVSRKKKSKSDRKKAKNVEVGFREEFPV